MGTLAGGFPHPPGSKPLSFKDALVSHATSSVSDPTAMANPTPLTDLGKHGTHKGSPAIYFSRYQISHYSDPYHQTLVAKFSEGYNKQNPNLGRPSLDKLHEYFLALDLHGELQLGLLDNRHVLLRCTLQEDFLRLYSRPVWYVRGLPMRIFKWSPGFHVERESPIVPVWISFPRLPIQFFNSEALFQLCRLIGIPLRMDAATQSLKRPSYTRVQIELDVLKPRPDHVWIGMEDLDGFWQPVEYESVPAYCTHCWHVGHSVDQCHVHKPELKRSATVQQRPEEKKKLVYVPKQTLASDTETGPKQNVSDSPVIQPTSPPTVQPLSTTSVPPTGPQLN